MVERGKGPLPKEVELQRGAKQARIGPTLANKRAEAQVGTPAWTPTMVLDGTPLPVDASIKDFQQERAGYVANVVEQALLLPGDMANLRTMRKHEVFFSLKRDLAKICLLHINFHMTCS